jgi:predicted short-subunit dehydrogenase-like oxidoreductase (DUF2520 family)
LLVMWAMKKKNFYTFSIVGLGMVGTAIGFLLKKAGHQIIAVYDKSPAALKRTKLYTGGKTFRRLQNVLNNADCILIATPDDAISSACQEIARSSAIKGKFIFHMSGAGGLDLLNAAKNAGAYIASIHPLQSFSSVENAISNIPKSYFGITADEKAKELAKNIVRDLGGIPFFISDKQKPLYHAAACLASNYLVCLLNSVESIYQKIGIDEKKAKKAYLPLVYGSLKNIERSGSILSLTGPIARGDFNTIKKHIKVINKILPQYSLLYTSLGEIAVKVAKKKGSLNARQAKIINELLKGAKKHEHAK